MDKIARLRELIDKEEQIYLSLKTQVDKMKDQMDYHLDKMKWYQKQLEEKNG